MGHSDLDVRRVDIAAFRELAEIDLLPTSEVCLTLSFAAKNIMLINSWSPDGAFIAASNAMNGPIFVAQVIEREGWGADISFVGHSNTIQVAVSAWRLFIAESSLNKGIQPSLVLQQG
jgi:hypothetical protein